MIELRFYGVKIQICFGFFAVMALMMTDGSVFPLTVLAVCAFHEMGHLAVMKLFGMKTGSVRLYGGGICIFPREPLCLLGFIGECAVLLGGAAANLLLFAVLFMTRYRLVGYVSLAMGGFSLLPLSTLDGGRLIAAAVSRFGTEKSVYRLERTMKVTDAVFGISLCIALVARGSINFTLPLTMAFIIGGTLADSKVMCRK